MQSEPGSDWGVTSDTVLAWHARALSLNFSITRLLLSSRSSKVKEKYREQRSGVGLWERRRTDREAKSRPVQFALAEFTRNTNSFNRGAGKMTQWLRVPEALAQHSSLNFSSPARKLANAPIPGDLAPSCGHYRYHLHNKIKVTLKEKRYFLKSIKQR